MDEDGHLGVRFEVYSPTLLPASSLLFLSTHRGQTLIAAAESELCCHAFRPHTIGCIPLNRDPK